MRSYGQYCAVAKALDVIGDRWNLLIVRELLLRPVCRYTDLRDGLPGIATNMLADRLRDLERAGIVDRHLAPPPIATTVFGLTERGRDLRPLVHEIARWGVPLMSQASDEDAFCSHWLAQPVALFLSDQTPEGPPIAIQVHTGEGEPSTIETIDGSLRVRPGPVEHPDLILNGTPKLVLGLLSGALSLAEAHTRGLDYQGDPGALDRVQPADASHARAGSGREARLTAGVRIE